MSMFINTHTCSHTYLYTIIHTFTHTYPNAYIGNHRWIHTYIIYMCLYANIHSTYTIYTHMRSLYTIMYIHALTNTHILHMWIDAHLQNSPLSSAPASLTSPTLYPRSHCGW